jgi:hypothetical protein
VAIERDHSPGRETGDHEHAAGAGEEIRGHIFSTAELSLLLRLYAPLPQESPLYDIVQHSAPGFDDSDLTQSLKTKKVLDEAGKPAREWNALFEGLVRPHWELSLLTHRWKDRLLHHRYFTAARGTRCFLSYSRDGENLHSLMILGDCEALRETLLKTFTDEIVPLAGNMDMHMTFGAFVALLGIIDLHRASYLVSWLERSPSYSAEFSLSELSYMIGKGLSSADPRWCVTLASIFLPRELSLVREHLPKALEELEKNSLISSSVTQGEERIFVPSKVIDELSMALGEVSAMTALKTMSGDSLSRKTFALVMLQGKEGAVSFDLRGENDDVRAHIFSYSENRIAECLTHLFRIIESAPGLSEEDIPSSQPPQVSESDQQELPSSQPPQAPESDQQELPSSQPLQAPESDQQELPSSQPLQAPESDQQELPSSQPLQAPESVQHGEREEAESEESASCPECGMENLREAFSCRECGSRLPSREILRTCPACKQHVKQESRFCRYCRFSFADDEHGEDRGPSTQEKGKAEPRVESHQESPRGPVQGRRLLAENSSQSDGSAAPVRRNMRLCPNCRRDVHKESQFCRFCGHNLSNKEELDG